jgi:hypothetical protein
MPNCVFPAATEYAPCQWTRRPCRRRTVNHSSANLALCVLKLPMWHNTLTANKILHSCTNFSKRKRTLARNKYFSSPYFQPVCSFNVPPVCWSYLIRAIGNETTPVRFSVTPWWLRSALFWNCMQRRLAVLYRRFGTNYRSYLQGSSSHYSLSATCSDATHFPFCSNLMVTQICALRGCYAALVLGPIKQDETSVTRYQSTLRKIPAERILHLRRVGNLKSRTMVTHPDYIHLQFSSQLCGPRLRWHKKKIRGRTGEAKVSYRYCEKDLMWRGILLGSTPYIRRREETVVIQHC